MASSSSSQNPYANVPQGEDEGTKGKSFVNQAAPLRIMKLTPTAITLQIALVCLVYILFIIGLS